MLNQTTVKQALQAQREHIALIRYQLNSSVQRGDLIVLARQDARLKIWHVKADRSAQREITAQVAEVCKLPTYSSSLWTDDIIGITKGIAEMCVMARAFRLVDVPVTAHLPHAQKVN